MPVVLLLSETKATMNYGDVEAPLLRIVDHKPFGPDGAPPGNPNLPPPPLPPVQQVLLPPQKPLRDEMDDSIPF
jgi:hypothetical protein